MGIPRHKQDQRPETLPVTINGVAYDVPVDEHPATLILVDFIPPSFETGALPQPGIHLRSHSNSLLIRKVEAFYVKEVYPKLPLSEKRRVQKDGRLRLTVTTSATFDGVALQAFAQLLAKIAHCLSVAKLGSERVTKNFVVPLILGKSNFYNHLVGTVPLERPVHTLPHAVRQPEEPGEAGEHELHRASLLREGSYWVVYIQLFKQRYQGNNPIHKVILGPV